MAVVAPFLPWISFLTFWIRLLMLARMLSLS